MSKTKAVKTRARGLILGMAAEVAGLKEAARGSVTDTVAGWMAPEYLVAAKGKLDGLTGDKKLVALEAFMQSWMGLRRSDLAAGRLQLRREELEWQRTNRKLEKEKEFEEWMKRPEIQKKYLPDPSRGISPETIEKIERELRLF